MKRLVLILAAVSTAWAQQAFEAASIKPDHSGGNYIEVTPGALVAHSATMVTCIKWAYDVQVAQIEGADPDRNDLLNTDRFEIVGKTTGPVADRQLRIMFQNLLSERFKLALHHETREMRAYALELEKKEPKFHETGSETTLVQSANGKRLRQWKATTMAQLAVDLSDPMRAMVIDRTGLTAKYDFQVDLTPYLPTNGERPDITSIAATAVREQLGLKLTPVRAPVDILVIDHLERPSAN